MTSSVKRVIRAGIAGCGKIAETKHLPELASRKDVEIAALFDINPQAALALKDKFNLNCAYICEDFKQLITREGLDCVYVLTPNATHAAYSIDAMLHGLDVMCEKPMAVDVSEAEKVVACARQTGRKYTVSYQNRFRRDVLALKRAVQAGELGEIYLSKAVALRRRGVPTWGIFQKMAHQGGGPLIDIGSHSIDLALWLMDNYDIGYVSGAVFHKIGANANEPNRWGPWKPEEFEVEDSAFGFAVMRNGALLQIESSWAINKSYEGEACAEICGTLGGADLRGGLSFNGSEDGKLFVRAYTDYSEINASHYAGASLEAESWISYLKGEGTHCVKPEQALAVTRVIDAVYTSARLGKAIEL